MPLSLLFEYLGTRINGPRAGAAHIVINWRFTDTQESLVSNLGHGALTTTLARTNPDANATVTLQSVRGAYTLQAKESLSAGWSAGTNITTGAEGTTMRTGRDG